MNKLISFLKSGVLVLTIFTGIATTTASVLVTPVYAADPVDTPQEQVQSGVKEVGGTGDANNASAFTNLLESIINLLLFIIGAIAVIMIIIGGIKYTTSNGDSAQVTSAKNTILYSVVGLVVAIMSYAIVNFVVTKL